MVRLEEAEEILNYWYAIESLKPNPFPKPEETIKESYCKLFGRFTEADDLLDTIDRIKKDSKYEEYSFYSNEIELCVGKIHIQEIIEKLFVIVDEEMQEEVETEVCLFTLRIDEGGKYIEHSLQISPFIWSTMNIIKDNKVDFQQLRPEAGNQYLKSCEEIMKNENESIDKQIWKIYALLNDELLKYLSAEAKEACALYVFTGYREEKWKNKNNGTVEYSNLKQSYFLNDLSMVSENLHSASKVLDYILALNYNTNDSKINMLKDMSEIKKWYTSDKMPLGKWPSKYSLSFMQQLAVNIGIDEEGAGKIFSVNGPPGTGKTTLLKEIIADTVVKRAIAISTYDKPDDMFKCQRLEGIYDRFTKEYYVPLKKFAKYEMLVVSSNNDAVQNLTLELPVAESVSLKNTGIKEFDIDNAEELSVNLSKSDTTEISEIYFSNAAQLINARHRGEENACWGLISAPLGKRENINKFASGLYRVRKLITEFKKEGNEPLSYAKAKENFEKRYEKVCEMRKKLSVYEQKEKLYQEADEKKDNLLKMYQKQKNEYKEELEEIQSKKDILKTEKYNVELEIEINKALLGELEQNRNELAKEIRKNTGFLKSLFGKKEDIAATNKKRDELRELEKEIKEKAELQNQNEKKRQEITYTISGYDEKIRKLQKERDRVLVKENAENEKYLELKQNILIDRINYMANGVTACVFSPETKEMLSGKDREKYEEVHCGEFLQYEAYNKERELLFYDALMLHKAVILNSNAIKKNIEMLLKYWGEWTINDGCRYKFSEKDREKMVPALFHTLFFLVPVLSSTFASIETMFKDIRNEEEFGLMIVDEAGQAVPQMAVGAFMRFQRAIVVGDPKQIEPVVTLEKCLRVNLFAEKELLQNYFEKDLSVQNIADRINCYSGKLAADDEQEEEWIGCPLVVHRRCLEPMFSISNDISYGKIMVNRACYDVDEEVLINKKSLWIDVTGTERGGKNHFVKEQGEVVSTLLKIHADKNGELGDLFIISPFRTVSNGIKEVLKKVFPGQESWIYKHCGTVHTFQGKEAKEVIYLLGCDVASTGAVKWVNKNNINVAVTRAKQRIYFVGDKELWKNNTIMRNAMKYVEAVKKEQIVAKV